MIDNNTVAILTKTNDLLERFGVHPCDVVVTTRSDDKRGTVLFFETPPPDPEGEERFFRMLTHLGLSDTQLELAGTDRHIYDRLQEALSRAPRTGPRR